MITSCLCLFSNILHANQSQHCIKSKMRSNVEGQLKQRSSVEKWLHSQGGEDFLMTLYRMQFCGRLENTVGYVGRWMFSDFKPLAGWNYWNLCMNICVEISGTAFSLLCEWDTQRWLISGKRCRDFCSLQRDIYCSGIYVVRKTCMNYDIILYTRIYNDL